MLRAQILAQKWLMENVRTNAYSIMGAWVGAWTDFQNTFEAGSRGCEVVFPEDDIPWVRSGWVKTQQVLMRLEEMDFIHRGLEFGASEAPYESVLEHFGGKVVLACRVGLHKDVKFRGMADYVRRIRSPSTTNRGLFIHIDITNGIVDDTWPDRDLNEIYRLLEG